MEDEAFGLILVTLLMMNKNLIFGCVLFFAFISCTYNDMTDYKTVESDSVKAVSTITNDTLKSAIKPVIVTSDSLPASSITTGNVPVDSVVEFAKTMIGTPYLYGSIDPIHGFDCSGFITYVFNHFKINVPRSSIDFTNVGKEIPVSDSKKGDLILFTGTDSTERFVGHMGIIISNENGLVQFIHSSSGKKANGVVITPFNNYYKGRFMKVVRIFKSLLNLPEGEASSSHKAVHSDSKPIPNS